MIDLVFLVLDWEELNFIRGLELDEDELEDVLSLLLVFDVLLLFLFVLCLFIIIEESFIVIVDLDLFFMFLIWFGLFVFFLKLSD